MVIVGRIYEIVSVSDMVSQIILRKKVRDKIVPVAISVIGYWKDKMISMNLKPKDKIRANFYMKSRMWNGKWYTDVYFREIDLIEKAPIKIGGNRSLFELNEEDIHDDGFIDGDGNLIDTSSGEKMN